MKSPVNVANVVQSFMVEETKNLVYDAKKQEEWKTLTASLGLKGQNEVLTPSKSPIPFTPMNRVLIDIFGELCGRREDIKDYKIAPIPVEVLGLAKLSIDEEYFIKMEVHYDDESPDPILIGLTGHWSEYDFYKDSAIELKNKQFNSQGDVEAAGGKHPNFTETGRYLIARWGDVAMSFEKLAEKAKERWIKKTTLDAKKQIARYEQDLANAVEEADVKFSV